MKKHISQTNAVLKPILLLLVALSMMSCSKSFYVVDHFEETTQNHESIAILPVEMIYLGKKPKSLSAEEIKQIEIEESKIFQASIFHEILGSTKRGKKPLRVEVQAYQTTLAMLEDKGISIHESWSMDPQDLMSILEVDAVLKGRVEKTRYMSDLTSYGIETGGRILSDVLPGGYSYTPVAISKAVDVSYSLVDTNGRHTLWSMDRSMNSTYRRNSQDMIDILNHRVAKKFPYRK